MAWFDAKLLRKDLALASGLAIEPAKPLTLRHHWLLLLSGGVTKPGRSGATTSRYSTIGHEANGHEGDGALEQPRLNGHVAASREHGLNDLELIRADAWQHGAHPCHDGFTERVGLVYPYLPIRSITR